QRNALGQDLFNKVCEHLDLLERDYYGLVMWDSPSTRVFILFFLYQLRKDILIGRLPCPPDILALLGSYTVQSTIGDYDPNLHKNNYVSEIVLAPNQSEELEERIMELHSTYRYPNAMGLPMYGVDLHPAKDVNDADVMLGVCSEGLMVYEDEIKTNIFLWPRVLKISHKRSTFLLKMRPSEGELGHHVVSLSMPSSRACKNLWKSCVDHHTFYDRKPSHSASKLRYAGRVTTDSVPLYRKLIGEKMFNPAVRSNSVEHFETKSLPSRSPPNTPNWRSPRLRHDFRKPRPSSVDNLTNEMSYVTESEDVFYTYRQIYSTYANAHSLNLNQRSESSIKASSSESSILFLSYLPQRVYFVVICMQSVTADGDLLLVRISPDQDGKFGFNVKGGVDQKMPLAISHVNPASPAGRCVPPLMEGDQVLLINGRDISEHTHQQVVMFIKASRESHSKELALLVRRKGVSLRAEPTLQLGEGLTLPGEISPLSTQPSGETPEESMTRLEKGLVTGTLLLHFEKLYRKKEGMSMSFAKQSENMDKNRYKDVLPYDSTRVVLQEEGDDYINASHVKNEPAGCVLRYIAAQGPLPHTCTHFWRSVWEQNVSVIIMLTTLTERGRTKCHQYWPHPPEVRDYGFLQVCCHSEECNLAYVTRELTLTNTQSGQQRSITHLQYVAWPDHGVPEDSSDFLDFVQSMRSMREESVPLMVHCSAGIGRTGVLITMETAMTLMEKEKPVYPLEIITLMREQRAMLVQTSCQFTFVCEAILRVYRERMKKSSTPNS
uniref:protein-tyrosine-phosphatase n=1 Tax=Sinocyclocheilus grahami TaxID=75366 RepID=A0A672SGH6_SINGR